MRREIVPSLAALSLAGCAAMQSEQTRATDYVGTEHQYQEYRSLAQQRAVADERL